MLKITTLLLKLYAMSDSWRPVYNIEDVSIRTTWVKGHTIDGEEYSGPLLNILVGLGLEIHSVELSKKVLLVSDFVYKMSPEELPELSDDTYYPQEYLYLKDIGTHTAKFWLDQGYSTKKYVSYKEIKEYQLIDPHDCVGLTNPFPLAPFLTPDVAQVCRYAGGWEEEHFYETGKPLPYIRGDECPHPSEWYILKSKKHNENVWHAKRASDVMYIVDDPVYGKHVYDTLTIPGKIIHKHVKGGVTVSEDILCMKECNRDLTRTPAASCVGSPNVPMIRSPPAHAFSNHPSPIALATGVEETDLDLLAQLQELQEKQEVIRRELQRRARNRQLSPKHVSF